MKLAKTSKLVEIKDRSNGPMGSMFNPQDSIEKMKDYAGLADKDLTNLFLWTNGRVRFGKAVDGERGENMDGEFQVFASNSSSTTDVTITHTLGALPMGFILINKNRLSDLAMVTTSTTQAVFAVGMTSTTFTIFLLK